MQDNHRYHERAAGIVAMILAAGLSLAVLCVTLGVLYDAIVSVGPGLSDHATQVLGGAFGGMIGVVGSYIGYQAASNGNTDSQLSSEEKPMTTTEPGNGDNAEGTEELEGEDNPMSEAELRQEHATAAGVELNDEPEQAGEPGDDHDA